MPKKARGELQVEADVSVNVGFGAKKNKHKPKDSMHLNGHDEMGSELRVTIPTGSKDVEAVTPTSTISSGFGTLVHSVNDPALQHPVRLPSWPDNRPVGFDVAGSPDNGTVIVQKLEDPLQKESPKSSADVEAYLKDGHRIMSVHIPLAQLRFEETVQLLNTLLPYKPEFYVKREPDWLANLQFLSDNTGHVGAQWPAESPKASSSGRSSHSNSPHPEVADSDDLAIGLLVQDEPHAEPQAVTMVTEEFPETDQEADFVEPVFEHDFLHSCCDHTAVQQDKLCQFAPAPVPVVDVLPEPELEFVDVEEEETEDLVRVSEQTALAALRDSDRMAKISLRSFDVVPLATSPKRGIALLQKRVQSTLEVQVEVEVPTVKPVEVVEPVSKGVKVTGLQAEVSGPEITMEERDEHRGRRKWRFFKKRNLKRGRSAPELPLDFNDHHEVYTEIPVEVPHAHHSRPTSEMSAEVQLRPKHGKHNRDNSLPPAVEFTEKEVVRPLGGHKHKNSIFSPKPEVEPVVLQQATLRVTVWPRSKSVIKTVAEADPNFKPALSTRTIRISGTEEAAPVARRASLIDRLTSKLKRSSSREPVKLLSVRKIEEPFMEVLKLPTCIDPAELACPSATDEQLAACSECTVEHQYLCSPGPEELNLVKDEDHLCAFCDDSTDRNNNAPDETEPQPELQPVIEVEKESESDSSSSSSSSESESEAEPVEVEEVVGLKKRGPVVHTAHKAPTILDPELLATAIEPDAHDAPRVENELLTPPLPVSQPPEPSTLVRHGHDDFVQDDEDTCSDMQFEQPIVPRTSQQAERLLAQVDSVHVAQTCFADRPSAPLNHAQDNFVVHRLDSQFELKAQPVLTLTPTAHQSPQLLNTASQSPPTEIRICDRRSSVISSSDEDVVPDFKPNLTRKNTLIRQKVRKSPPTYEDASNGCDLDSSDDDLDADRLSVTASLINDLLESDSD